MAKSNKGLLIIGGLAVAGWYVFDKLGIYEGAAKDEKKGDGGDKKPPKKTPAKDKSEETPGGKGGKFFDFMWGSFLGNVEKTASDARAYEGANKKENWEKSGPFKGVLVIGSGSQWAKSKEAEKWYKTKAGQQWTKEVQDYFKSKGGPGKVSKAEYEGVWKAVPLPKSAPWDYYKDAAGRHYKSRGSAMSPYVPGLDTGKQAQDNKSAIEKQIEALQGKGL